MPYGFYMAFGFIGLRPFGVAYNCRDTWQGLSEIDSGIYNLKAAEVSNLFKNILEEPEFKNKFKKIVFAIFEGKGSTRKVVGRDGKFKAFDDIFTKR